MKQKIEALLAALRRGGTEVVRHYPLETILLAGAALGWILIYELDLWSDERVTARIGAAAWYAFVLLIVDRAAGRGPWRKLYWAAWAPLVPLLCWPGLPAWVASPQFAVTAAVLSPLAFLMARWATQNERFVAEAFVCARAGASAFLFSYLLLGLFEAILWSAAYVFGFDHMTWVAHVGFDAWVLTAQFIGPVLFLLLLDRWAGAPCRGSRLLEAVVHYLFTPALMIYAALLYLYVAQILITWSLPRGGVAWMVFAFVLVFLIVRMLRELLDKRVAEWFYRSFGRVTLPAVVLFWTGVARRIGEYGLTESRVYLLVCGAVMTLAVAFFSSRRLSRYLWLCLAAFGCFAAVAYVPVLSPRRIGLHAQQARFERLARPLALIDAEGRLRTQRVPLADTVHWRTYREAFAALDYVLREDTAYYHRLGLAYEHRWRYEEELLPEALRNRIHGWEVVEAVETDGPQYLDLELPTNYPVAVDPAYPRLYAKPQHRRDCSGVRLERDTLRLEVDGKLLLKISGAELVRQQLLRNGLTFEALYDLDDERLGALLDYRGERVRVLFDRLKIERRDSIRCRLEGIEAELFWTR